MSTVSSVITAVGYNLDLSIDTSSEPSSTELIQWLNEDILWIVGICAEEGSDLGQAEGSFNTVAGTSSYSDLATDMYATDEYGWIEGAASRNKLRLTARMGKLGYNPAVANRGEPERYYVDGSNNVVLLPTPDNVYAVRIPYWQIQTALTATTDTVPFNGLFDNVLIQVLTIKAQNRDEYNIEFEQSWLNFLVERVRNLIRMRINSRQRIKVSRSERFISENVRTEKAATA